MTLSRFAAKVRTEASPRDNRAAALDHHCGWLRSRFTTQAAIEERSDWLMDHYPRIHRISRYQ